MVVASLQNGLKIKAKWRKIIDKYAKMWYNKVEEKPRFVAVISTYKDRYKGGHIMDTINTTPRDIIVIYSPRMAGYLMLRGFYLVGVQPNLKRPGKNCFSFFSSPMLKDAMEDYLNRRDELNNL